MRKLVGAGVALTLALALVGIGAPAKADLPDILNKGVIRIGTLLDNVPFGQVGSDGKPTGFDIELGEMIGKAMGVKVQLEPIVSANRIPFLLTNKIDIVVGCMAPTPERAVQVMFSSPYSYQFNAVWGSKGTAVKAAQDMAGLKIAVAKGTTQDLTISAMKPTPNVLRFENDGAAVAAFLSGQTDLFATISTQAYGIAKLNPDKNIELKFKIAPAPCSIAMRQGDFQLLRMLDTMIMHFKLNGELERLHQQYIGAPMGDLPVI